MPLRVVLDTNVVVSACLTPQGAPATILELALLGEFIAAISAEVLDEYLEVLSRPKFSRAPDRISVVLAGLMEIAVRVEPAQRTSVSSDDDDNRLLERAEAADADFLVTGNQAHFPSAFGRTKIVSPRQFLDAIGY